MTTPNSAKIRFYVDGLNLHYGVARRYGIRWLDIEKLLLRLVRDKIPNATAEKILVFTGVLRASTVSHRHQQSYLYALEQHSPAVEIVLGHFQSVEKTGIVVRGQGINTQATIKTWEEKCTDVNLGCRIVEDAFSTSDEDDYDMGCLVSNDSDFAYALEVKRRLKQKIMLITPRTPQTKTASSARLRMHVPKKDRISTISRELVAACQLPDTVGEYTKPAAWS